MENLSERKKCVMVFEASNVGLICNPKATKLIHSKHLTKNLYSLTVYFREKKIGSGVRLKTLSAMVVIEPLCINVSELLGIMF